jgi:hypothetical protein
MLSLSISDFGILLMSYRMLSGIGMLGVGSFAFGLAYFLISSGKYSPDSDGPSHLCGSSVLESIGINFPLSDLNPSSQ